MDNNKKKSFIVINSIFSSFYYSHKSAEEKKYILFIIDINITIITQTQQRNVTQHKNDVTSKRRIEKKKTV